METGPQRYPGASTAYWYGSTYPGSAMESNVVCWHTTEGTSLPSYDGGAMAPNFTAKPNWAAKKLDWYQHFDFDVSSRALRNLSGGVETNTLNVVQVEIVGTCDPTTHTAWTNAGYPHLYSPELPDWAIRDLAAFARWAHDEHNVPLSSGLTFKAYPGSYGANGVRMTGSQWTGFTGHCGHQHVPENDHGDPGAMPIATILAVAKNGTIPEDDVALTVDDIKLLAAKDGIWPAPKDATNYSDDPASPDHYWSLQAHITGTTSKVRGIEKAVAALAAKVDALPDVELSDQQIATLAAAVAANPALAELIAEKVAVKLAARLAE